MKKIFFSTLIALLILAGCSKQTDFQNIVQLKQEMMVGKVVLPSSDYGERLKYKSFGEYIQDRFKGYHVGDDIEYGEVVTETPINAIADGIIEHVGRVSGYGGLIVIKHFINGKSLNALYGHLDISAVNLKKGDSVSKGDFLANLGDHKSEETDGERKHLHFGLYEGAELRIQGYESLGDKVSTWINPYDFFLKNKINIGKKARIFEAGREAGGDVFNLEFQIPEGWEVEYIPSIQALNLFTLSGSGAARERSQILIRYFDAENFLTLPTVTIHQTNDLKISEGYTARRYEIEKKNNVVDFPEQPEWRNRRHVVTDFRGKEGFTRYYVVAANPAVDVEIYDALLASMKITSL